jgi:RNA polymerase sigma factor (sigma-70 family)
MMVPHQLLMQSDSQLLQAFCADQDQHAFAALVQAHGPMVWRVCRHVLRQTEDAEDAFQATFLILARRANSIRKAESLPSWLHGVAYRISVKARESAVRRNAREARTQPGSTPDPASEVSWREVQALLHEEVDRLPEKYRAPFVLCLLEGRSRAEVAQRLGLQEGTVWSRLAEARQRLQGRLARRGISLSAVLTAATIADGEAPAAVAARLAEPAILAALEYAAGKPIAAGLVSSKVIGLANGRMASMLITKVKFTVAVVVASAGITSAGLLAHQGFPSKAPEEARETPELQQADQQAKPSNVAEQKAVPGQDSNGDKLPAGALVRLGADRFRRDGGDSGVVAFSANGRLAFSADGSSLYAAGMRDGMIHAWDVNTGKETRKLSVFEDRQTPRNSLAISPDGKLVGAFANENLTIWSVLLARQTRQIKLPSRRPDREVVFTPDNKSVAFLSGEDGNSEVSFVDLNTGKIHQIQLQARPPSPPQPELRPQAAARRGRQGNAAANLSRLFHLDFSPDGQVIFCKTMNGPVQFWNSTGVPLTNYPTDAQRCAFSPDGRTLLVGKQMGVYLWDLAAGKQLAELPGMRTHAAVAFSPDGKTVAASSMMSVVLWDTTTAKQLHTIGGLGRSSNTTIHLLRFSPDSKTLVGAGGETVIRVWDVATGKEREADIGHRGAITDIIFAPDGNSLATSAHADPNVRLWQANSGKALQFFLGGFKAGSLHFSSDGSSLLATGPSVFIWDPANGKEQQRLSFPRDPRDRPGIMQSIESIAILPDGVTVRALRIRNPRLLPRGEQPPGQDSNLALVASWDMATGREIAHREDPIEPDSQWVLSSDGRLRASFHSGRFSKVHEASTGKLVTTLDGQCEFLWTVAFSPDTQKLAGLCHQGYERPLTLIVWDLSTGKEIRRILTEMKAPGPLLPGYLAAALAFSANGKILATGAQENGGIQLWDLVTGKEIGRFRGYPGTVTSLAFDANGRRLASGLANGTALIWNVAKAAEQPTLAKLPKPIEMVPAPPKRRLAEPPRPLEGAAHLIRDLVKEAQNVLLNVEDKSAKIHGLEQCAILEGREGNLALAHATLDQASKLIAQLPENGQRNEGIALTKACAETGDLDALKKAIESLPKLQRPYAGTMTLRDQAIYTATMALAKAGKGKDALEFTKVHPYERDAEFARNRVLGETAAYFARIGNLKKAWDTLDTVSDPYVKVVTVTGFVRDNNWNLDLPSPPAGIALELDEAGNRPAARQILKQALEFAAAIKDPTKQAQALAAIACCQARVGEVDGARTTQEKIPPDSKFRPLPLMAIARAVAATGHSTEARHVIDSLPGALLQSEGFYHLALGQLTAGDRKGALESCDKSWELVQSFRDQDVYFAAHSLIGFRIKARDYQGAAAVAGYNSRVGSQYLFDAIISDQTEADDFKAAFETIRDHLSENSLSMRLALQKLSKVQAEQNQEMEALAWARQLTKPDEQAFALLGVAEGLFKRLK